MINHALVVGGGIGGMTAAIALARRGVAVTLIDSDPDWRVYGAGISVTGVSLRAFDDLGILDAVRQRGFVGAGIRLRAVDGSIVMTSPVPEKPMPIESGGGIMRPVLHEILSQAVRQAGVDVRLGVTVEHMDSDANGVDVTFSDGRPGRFDVVVAADGIFSATRQRLFPDVPGPQFTGQGCWRILAPRPPTVDRTEIYVGGPVKLGINPVSATHVYLFVLEHVPDNPRFAPDEQVAHLSDLLTPFGGDIPAIRAGLGVDSQINYRPLEWLLVPSPWNRGRIVLIGDAAHATTPHMAAGAGMAVEDGLVLADELMLDGDVEAALTRFMAADSIAPGWSCKIRFGSARSKWLQAIRLRRTRSWAKPCDPFNRATDWNRLMSFGLATLTFDHEPEAALVVGDRAVPLARIGETRDILSLLDDWDNVLPTLERAASDPAFLADASDLNALSIHAPYRPRQIFCTGANYKKHVVGLIMGDPSMRTAEHEAMDPAERQRQVEKMMDERASALPYCFIKLPSCVVGPNDDVVLPRNVEKPDWELELGVVIGRPARHVSPEEAMAYVAGYVIVNDVTAREHIFRRDGSAIGADWLSGKCFPTFLPFGPVIVPRQFVADPYDLTINLAVNGKIFQNESTSDMMISVERQVAYLSDRVELCPGDVICTGSPYGNGAAFGVFLQDGDVMDGSITGLGMQRNRCVSEKVRA